MKGQDIPDKIIVEYSDSIKSLDREKKERRFIHRKKHLRGCWMMPEKKSRNVDTRLRATVNLKRNAIFPAFRSMRNEYIQII